MKVLIEFLNTLLDDSIEIKTTPEKIWGFFVHIDENYKAWHPDHVTFCWVKGRPLEEGTIGYFEEYLHGEMHKARLCTLKLCQTKRSNSILHTRSGDFFTRKAHLP